ncbi:MAG: HAD-IIIA family hydrolase [Spirochaetes bacterium]|nr:HAD-IIIA family hydrolase [Spirochaetota bacterium]
MKAIFFDRDGTLNIDSHGYINDPKEMHLFLSSAEVLKYLKLLEYKIFIISNQSGIGRGKIAPDSYRRVNDKFLMLAGGYNTIDDILYCPHTPEQNCNCRKPELLLLDIIREQYRIDFKASYFVGDKITDIYCGKQAGLKTIMIDNSDSGPDDKFFYEGKVVKPGICIQSVEEILNIIEK